VFAEETAPEEYKDGGTLTVSLDCESTPETVTVTNDSGVRATLVSLTSTAAPLAVPEFTPGIEVAHGAKSTFPLVPLTGNPGGVFDDAENEGATVIVHYIEHDSKYHPRCDKPDWHHFSVIDDAEADLGPPATVAGSTFGRGLVASISVLLILSTVSVTLLFVRRRSQWKLVTARRSTFVAAGVLALALLPAATTATHSPVKWSQLYSPFTMNGDVHTCGLNSGSPCIEWASAGSTLDYYFESTVNDYIRQYFGYAVDHWNAKCGFQPHFQRIYNNTDEEIHVQRVSLGAGRYGQAMMEDAGDYVEGSTHRAYIVHAYLRFNTDIGYNTTETYNSSTADVRKVASHELGHTLGIGHADWEYAIMTQGGATSGGAQLQRIWPAEGETNAIDAIYGGNCP